MRGLLASHAPPDRDDPALLRSFAVQVEETLTSGYDVDWHPGGDLLAVVNGGPTLQIFAAGSGTRDSAVETSGTRMEPGASPTVSPTMRSSRSPSPT